MKIVGVPPLCDDPDDYGMFLTPPFTDETWLNVLAPPEEKWANGFGRPEAKIFVFSAPSQREIGWMFLVISMNTSLLPRFRVFSGNRGDSEVYHGQRVRLRQGEWRGGEWGRRGRRRGRR